MSRAIIYRISIKAYVLYQRKMANGHYRCAFHLLRYRELWVVHGDSMVSADDRAGSGRAVSNLASNMGQVTLSSLAAASCTLEPVRKRLPASMTVGKLKTMCKRLFKVDTDQQVLWIFCFVESCVLRTLRGTYSPCSS